MVISTPLSLFRVIEGRALETVSKHDITRSTALITNDFPSLPEAH
jgi:hypothetical protein